MRKDGTRWPVLLSVSPLRNARGEIVGASAIARDISAEKQSEEAIRRSEKLATAGRLAASIAHEINNPLEAVINLLYLARHDSSHAVEYLTQAEQEVGRVARLAQQTLGFVRDASSPASMDPAAIMDEILQLYSRKLESRQIRVTRRYRAPLRDQRIFRRVAPVTGQSPGKCGGCDGRRRHSASPRRRRARLVERQASEGVRITVADNGSGIPRESLRQIFEPFYTTKKETGTGLGLWVSRGIVQKHGGSIRVRSRSRMAARREPYFQSSCRSGRKSAASREPRLVHICIQFLSSQQLTKPARYSDFRAWKAPAAAAYNHPSPSRLGT